MSSEYLLRSGQVIRANFLSCRHVGPMLGLASLMTIGILGLCVAQDIGSLPARLRGIFDGTTASVMRDEDSSPNQDSSQFSSLPHSLHSDHHHANRTKQRHQLNSKFSRSDVVAWDETENKATKVEGGKRFEKQQVNTGDEGKHVVEWTPQRNARRRRVETLHSSETSSYKHQRQMPNSVGDTSKKAPRIKRQRRSSPIKKKSSRVVLLRGRNLRGRAALRESRSSAAGLDAKRSKTGRRRKIRTASRDSYHGNANSKKRRRLNRRQGDEDYMGDVEESLADEEEEELKDERDVGLEESVEKRDSDEVMISKDVLAAMNERILARVKDFIDKNTEKKGGSSSNNSTEVVSGGMGVGGGNATTEASSSSTVHPQSSTSH